MKAFVLVFVLTVIHYTNQQAPPQLQNIANAEGECIKATGVDPKLTQKAFMEGKFEDDKNLKCFMKCMFVKMGDMTEAGELLPDNMKGQAPPGITPAQATQIVDKCKVATGADPCEIAFNAAKCMVDESIKLIPSNG